ncbi:MAG TPA: type I glutamate--ammonia ligase [Ignisphaera sp.]|nr:type I glutamate--ammonia ligase [Ignisphaera sp.]
MEDFIDVLDKFHIEWLDLQFTDLFGTLRHVAISRHLVDREAIERGFGKLDGSSVKGFTGIEESDLVLKPVIDTLALLPWCKKVARVRCRIYSVGGEKRFIKDPRLVAETIDEYLAREGMKAFVSPELEYFVFDRVTIKMDPWFQYYEIKSIEGPWSGEGGVFNRLKEGYYVVPPKDKLFNLKIEVAEALEKYFGIEVEVLHHEVAAASQHEIVFRGGNVVVTSDRLQTVKFVIRSLTAEKGLVATFMPKPLYGDNGSGLHVHVSLWKGDDNLFYDPDDDYAELSQFARYFIGGLIEHGRALSAIVSPTVNSYRRLIPGYEAPVYLVWSKANRSAAIRVPVYLKKNPRGARIEYRPPDPSANPYLALSAIILAGLDGVRKKIEPGDPVDENVYKMPIEKRRALGIKELPRSLDEALDELESDNEWLKPVFPRELIESYIDMKREEAKTLAQYVSPAEAYYYIDV